MTDYRERAREIAKEQIAPYVPEWEAHYGEYLDTLTTAISSAMEEAERVGRVSGVREAMAVAGSMAERPYDNEPEFSAVLAVEHAIRSLIKDGEDVTARPAGGLSLDGEAQDGWQPIGTAPRDGTHILAYEETGDIYRASYGDESWRCFGGQPVVYTPEPTHWMPLPAAPTGEAGE